MLTEEILSPFRQIFEKELIEEISQNGRVLEVQAGDVIMEPGKYIKTIPVILNGLIKVMRRDEDGNEVLLYYIGTGETCAMSLNCCVAHAQSDILAVAEEDSELLLIPAEKMDEWTRRYSSWHNFVMQTYGARFSELLKAVDGIAFKKVDERLEQYLKNKAEHSGSNIIHVSHQVIADELNTSREVVSRLLKTMENEGRIKLGRNRIELLHPVGSFS